MFAIQLSNLSKTFGRGKKRVVAVNDISLEIEAGQVYGFLGPNGAGKTTTIRMLLDLIRPSKGEAHLFGKPVRDERKVLARVGALVEGAAFYPYLSGRKNLIVLARTADDYDPARIDALLEQVNLAHRANERVRGYSTGMKQRLGLAAALLHDPDLLILDEPTNGLDPAGIQEMRTFIREQADVHGKTVFLSSHMLNEVEQICDRIAIINKGQILREGRVSDIVETGTQFRLDARPAERIAAVLDGRWTVHEEDGLMLVSATLDDVPAIVRALVAAEIDVYEVARHRRSLESVFLSITSDSPAEKEPIHA